MNILKTRNNRVDPISSFSSKRRSSDRGPDKLRLEMFLLVVDAGESLAVKHAVVPAVVDPGVAIHTHDVGRVITGLREPKHIHHE